MQCPRCQGFMIQDNCYDANGSCDESEVILWRCLICGSLYDTRIATNRFDHLHGNIASKKSKKYGPRHSYPT
jgi:hypothetical protein